MDRAAFVSTVSEFAKAVIPFIFLVDFERKKPFVCRLNVAAKHGVFYNFRGKSNVPEVKVDKKVQLENTPISKEVFQSAFAKVVQYLNDGDTYLLNLTFPTSVTINLDLQEVFHVAQAPYKLKFKEEFVSFSPETFIQIRKGQVHTFPMKGTIDATLPRASETLLEDEKEKWEHNTIVDLMRNDMAMISESVVVAKYRYLDRIKTHRGELLQTSSEIMGQLSSDWKEALGETIMTLLPAGSISGAPKKKTVEIIQAVEGGPRGYYTGVYGIFDGESLDSAVSIRYLEKKADQLFFRSGGGITAKSVMEDEYKELIQKIYVPTI